MPPAQGIKSVPKRRSLFDLHCSAFVNCKAKGYKRLRLLGTELPAARLGAREGSDAALLGGSALRRDFMVQALCANAPCQGTRCGISYKLRAVKGESDSPLIEYQNVTFFGCSPNLHSLYSPAVSQNQKF